MMALWLKENKLFMLERRVKWSKMRGTLICTLVGFVFFLKSSFKILVIFEDNKNVLYHDNGSGYISMHLSKLIKLYT